ncbi:MAG: glycosyltransferase [Deltaproteobacteria bacterium]|nr:glycosyltransferase [Deltaproteobacteria bacterium]
METVLAAVVLAGMAWYLMTLVAVFRRLSPSRRARRASPPLDLPSVTILKPIKGVDSDLEDNLLSFIRQDYPSFEVVFGIQDPFDPALPTLRRIRDAHPEVPVRIVQTLETPGFNPKVNNLLGMMRMASHDVMVISDSNVRVSPSYLSENVPLLLRPGAGLVCNLIRGRGDAGLGSLMESLHLNTFLLGNTCLVDRLAGEKIVVGKSIFFRKSELDSLGGLAKLKDVLAEDYLMGRLYLDAGRDVAVSAHVIDTWTRGWGVRQFLSRHARWARLRWQINRTAYVLEFLTNAPFWATVLALVSGFSAPALAVAVSAFLVKGAGDQLCNLRLGRPVRSGLVLLSPLKDVVVAAIFPVPLVSSHTNWRGNRLRITRGTVLVPAR